MTPQKFLRELKSHNTGQYQIVSVLRDLILASREEVTEEVKYGGLLYSLEKPCAGIFVYKNHVSMEFSEGAQFADPKKLLKGKGAYRRHLTFATVGDLIEEDVRTFLSQALHTR
jgi:hypothetical protein